MNDNDIKQKIISSLEKIQAENVLIVPPDFTRFFSNAGLITNICYHYLTSKGIEVTIIPALGTHVPMTDNEILEMYGDIPLSVFKIHNWKTDVEKIGTVPSSFISKITDGLWTEELIVEINKEVLNPKYQLILSIGQVVPHEVIGMANHSKNLFVGLGGEEMINKSHMIGAVYGMERMMGKDFTPVRKIFDYSFEHFLNSDKFLFILTVTTEKSNQIFTHGLFIGKGRKPLEDAIDLSQKKNIDFIDKGIKKCIVYLDPKEFKSTWIGNKSIYRTRMAIEDGGKLIVLAPGVEKFGEDIDNDKIIRKYGYCGRLNVLNLYRKNEDLIKHMGAAAHLIHGSSDGRFSIFYAVKENFRKEIESVHFQSLNYDNIIKKYDPKKMKYGYNTIDGEEVFFIPNPALGLWINKEKFGNK